MSWSEVFPVLTDEMVDAFESDASIKERKVLESYFSVAAVHNARPEARHIVSTCIFWKNIKESMPGIEIKNRAQVMRPGKKGLLRFDPWSHYVEPLIRGAYWLHKHRKEAVFRVYLAADMKFLVPDLVAAGCEVMVMRSSSLAHNPGAMWRFLAFEDAGNGRMVTVVDADRAGKPETDMAQTEEATRLGLGWWRVPVWGELNEVGNVSYRPFIGCQLGGNQRLPTKLLMQALIWHTQKGTIDPMAKLPGCKPARVHGSGWPDYGFDEWFLLTSVYPRAAFDGLLTFVPAEAKSRLLPLDIEYAQWANNKSEMVYFGSAGGGCCGGVEPLVPIDQYIRKNEHYWTSVERLPKLLKGVGLDGSGFVLGKPKSLPASFSTPEERMFRKKIRVIEASAQSSEVDRKADFVWVELRGDAASRLNLLDWGWRKLKTGGILAGKGGKDRFVGSPYGECSWESDGLLLQHWAEKMRAKVLKTRHESTSEAEGWMIWKKPPIRPEDILVLTACTKDVKYSTWTVRNHKSYCQKHGFQYKCLGEEVFEREPGGKLQRAGCWYKIPAVQKVMATGMAKWIFWIDVDALFNNWNVSLTEFCLPGIELLAGIWDHGGDHRPSVGTFLIKNSKASSEFLEKWWASPISHFGGAHEEDALVAQLKKQPAYASRVLCIDAREINSRPPDQDWNREDFVLHFLQVKQGREEMIRSACQMAESRNEGIRRK